MFGVRHICGVCTAPSGSLSLFIKLTNPGNYVVAVGSDAMHDNEHNAAVPEDGSVANPVPGVHLYPFLQHAACVSASWLQPCRLVLLTNCAGFGLIRYRHCWWLNRYYACVRMSAGEQQLASCVTYILASINNGP